MNYKPTTDYTEARLPELAVEGPPASAPPAGTDSLAHLKNRLLRESLAAGAEEPLATLLRLTATEAEAQAWLTPFPLLIFPALYEEKTEEVRRYVTRQRRLRRIYPVVILSPLGRSRVQS